MGDQWGHPNAIQIMRNPRYAAAAVVDRDVPLQDQMLVPQIRAADGVVWTQIDEKPGFGEDYWSRVAELTKQAMQGTIRDALQAHAAQRPSLPADFLAQAASKLYGRSTRSIEEWMAKAGVKPGEINAKAREEHARLEGIADSFRRVAADAYKPWALEESDHADSCRCERCTDDEEPAADTPLADGGYSNTPARIPDANECLAEAMMP